MLEGKEKKTIKCYHVWYMICSNEETKQIFEEGRKVFDTSHISKQMIGCTTKYGESNFGE